MPKKSKSKLTEDQKKRAVGWGLPDAMVGVVNAESLEIISSVNLGGEARAESVSFVKDRNAGTIDVMAALTAANIVVLGTDEKVTAVIAKLSEELEPLFRSAEKRAPKMAASLAKAATVSASAPAATS